MGGFLIISMHSLLVVYWCLGEKRGRRLGRDEKNMRREKMLTETDSSAKRLTPLARRKNT